MNSCELVGVVHAGGEPGIELFLGGHLCHLILHRSDIVAASVLAVVAVAHFEEPCVQFFLSLGGNLSPFFGERTGADAVGPGILLGLQLGYDDFSGVVGGRRVMGSRRGGLA